MEGRAEGQVGPCPQPAAAPLTLSQPLTPVRDLAWRLLQQLLLLVLSLADILDCPVLCQEGLYLAALCTLRMLRVRGQAGVFQSVQQGRG